MNIIYILFIIYYIIGILNYFLIMYRNKKTVGIDSYSLLDTDSNNSNSNNSNNSNHRISPTTNNDIFNTNF